MQQPWQLQQAFVQLAMERALQVAWILRAGSRDNNWHCNMEAHSCSSLE